MSHRYFVCILFFSSFSSSSTSFTSFFSSPMNPQRLHAIMSGQDRGLGARALRLGLACAEPIYRGVVGLRNRLFDLGIRKARKLPRPVISVGNITTGGTGKTPMVIEIVCRLLAMGQKPAVLMRGVGQDEYRELDETINRGQRTNDVVSRSTTLEEMFQAGCGVPVVPHPSRHGAGLDVLTRLPETSVFVLDDGFQHRQLHRDLDLVLVDAVEPFGFGHVLPRGMLRESLRGLSRSDAMIVTRADRATPQQLGELDATLARYAGKPPLAHAAHEWSGFEVYDATGAWPATTWQTTNNLRDGKAAGIDQLRDAKVVAVCGIGNPGAFLQTLRQHVREIAAEHLFPDHHAYTLDQVTRIVRDAIDRGAAGVVTTAKDFVKWRAFLPPFGGEASMWYEKLPRAMPIYRPKLVMRFMDGSDSLDALLRGLWT